MLHVPVIEYHRSLANKMFTKCNTEQKFKVLTQTNDSLAHLVHDTADYIRSTCAHLPESVSRFMPTIQKLHEEVRVISDSARLEIIEEGTQARELFVSAIMGRLQLHELHNKIIAAVKAECVDAPEPMSKSIVQVKRPTTVQLNETNRGILGMLYNAAMGHFTYHKTLYQFLYIMVILSTLANLAIAGNLQHVNPHLNSGMGWLAYSMNNVGGAILSATLKAAEWPIRITQCGMVIAGLFALVFNNKNISVLKVSFINFVAMMSLCMVVSMLSTEAHAKFNVPVGETARILQTQSVVDVATDFGMTTEQAQLFIQRTDRATMMPDPTMLPDNELQVCSTAGKMAFRGIGDILTELLDTIPATASGLVDMEYVNAPVTSAGAEVMSNMSPLVRGIAVFHMAAMADTMSIANPIGDFLALPETGLSAVFLGTNAYVYATSSGLVLQAAPVTALVGAYALDAKFTSDIGLPYTVARDSAVQAFTQLWKVVASHYFEWGVKKTALTISGPAYENIAKPAIRKELTGSDWVVGKDGKLHKAHSWKNKLTIGNLASDFAEWYFVKVLGFDEEQVLKPMEPYQPVQGPAEQPSDIFLGSYWKKLGQAVAAFKI